MGLDNQIWRHVQILLVGARWLEAAINNTAETHGEAEGNDAEMREFHENASHRKGNEH